MLIFSLNYSEEFTYNCAADSFSLSDEVSSNTSEVPDDFDYVVTAEQWSGVLEAVKNQDQDQLKSQLQKVDDDVQKQKLVNFSCKVFDILFVLMHYHLVTPCMELA